MALVFGAEASTVVSISNTSMTRTSELVSLAVCNSQHGMTRPAQTRWHLNLKSVVHYLTGLSFDFWTPRIQRMPRDTEPRIHKRIHGETEDTVS